MHGHARSCRDGQGELDATLQALHASVGALLPAVADRVAEVQAQVTQLDATVRWLGKSIWPGNGRALACG